MKIIILGKKTKFEENKYKKFAQQIIKQYNNRLFNTSKVLNIVLVDDSYTMKLNKKFLNKNRPTDVLAFLLNEEVWAEIYISKDRAKSQARQRKITQGEEICNLIKHGILHLLGYSHQAMKRL